VAGTSMRAAFGDELASVWWLRRLLARCYPGRRRRVYPVARL
jgi:hypothetical protein